MKHWVILKVPKEFPNYPNIRDFGDHDTFWKDDSIRNLIMEFILQATKRVKIPDLISDNITTVYRIE